MFKFHYFVLTKKKLNFDNDGANCWDVSESVEL